MAKGPGENTMSRPISGAMIGGGNAGQSWNSSTNKNILAGEAAIKDNSSETAMVFDVSGNLITSSKGNSHQVSVGNVPEGSILTHNHPGGGTLSKQDILSGTSMNLSEIRAVTSKRVYSMKRPAGGWGDRAKWIPAISRAETRVREKLQSFVRRGQRISYFEARKRQITANEIRQHLVWKAVSKEFGWTYRKSET